MQDPDIPPAAEGEAGGVVVGARPITAAAVGVVDKVAIARTTTMVAFTPRLWITAIEPR